MWISLSNVLYLGITPWGLDPGGTPKQVSITEYLWTRSSLLCFHMWSFLVFTAELEIIHDWLNTSTFLSYRSVGKCIRAWINDTVSTIPRVVAIVRLSDTRKFQVCRLIRSAFIEMKEGSLQNGVRSWSYFFPILITSWFFISAQNSIFASGGIGVSLRDARHGVGDK